MAEKPEKFFYGNHGPWRIPIPEEAKNALTTNLPFLTENIELNETFWSHLMGCGFTIYDRQDVERGHTNDQQRVVALLEKLKIRSKGHLISFIQGLKDSGQVSVLQKLGLGYEMETRASNIKVYLINCTSCSKDIKEAFKLHNCCHMVCSKCAKSDQIMCQDPTCQAPRKVKDADPEMTEVIRSLNDSGRFINELLKCDQCKRNFFVEHLLHRCSKCSELLCARCLKQHTQLIEHQVDHFHQSAACCIHGRPTQAYCSTCRLYVCTTCLLDGCNKHDAKEDIRTTRKEDCVSELVKALEISKETATSQISVLEEYPMLVEQLNKKVEDYTSHLRRWMNMASQLSDDLQATLPSMNYTSFVQKLGVLSPQIPDQVWDFFISNSRDLGIVHFDQADLMLKMDNLPTTGRLLGKIPASGDPTTSGWVQDLAWDRQGHLLVAQKTDRLDRIVMDAESNQLLAQGNICKNQRHIVTSVSVNENGDIGAIIFNNGVLFNTPSCGNSTFWEPSPSVSGLQCISMFKQRFCICSENRQSTVFVYNTNNRSLLKSIPLHNEMEIYYMSAIDDHTLVISEPSGTSVILVNIETEKVTRATPKHPDGENVLSDPRGVSCDPHGRIYVCDRNQKKVFLLSRDGEFLATIRGDLEGGLESPRALAVRCKDGQCTLAVSDGKEVKFYALSEK